MISLFFLRDLHYTHTIKSINEIQLQVIFETEQANNIHDEKKKRENKIHKYERERESELK
jgi:hypothetical protein